MKKTTIEEILGSLRSKNVESKIHRSKTPTDHYLFDGQLVVLVEHTKYSIKYSGRTKGCAYGCSLHLYDSSGEKIAKTQEYRWRSMYFPDQDKARNRFLEILDIDGKKVLVNTPGEVRWIQLKTIRKLTVADVIDP